MNPNILQKKLQAGEEKEISQSNETVCEIILGGIEIPKSEYDMY